MSDFITLTCPSCGNRLQITQSIDRFACSACGNEHLVKREGGVVYLAPLVEGMHAIRTGVDRTAAELAVRRLKEEIAYLEARNRDLDTQIHQALNSNSGCRLVLLLAGAVLALFTFVTWSQSASVPVTPLVLTIVCFGILFDTSRRSSETATALREEQERVKAGILSNQKQLQKHLSTLDI